MPEAASTLTCSRCGAGISNDDLGGGLAVRVDGDLVCQMCVDTLPGEAVVRINQVRALRGLEATTYSVKHVRTPRLQLFSFTTSANITNHRRKLALDGFFDAPPLPPPAERQRIPTPPPPPKIVTDRVARGQMPGRLPMLLAGGGTLVVLAGIAIAIALAAPEKKPAAATVGEGPAELPTPPPAKAMKTRLDYPVDALQAWVQASQDRDCPTLVQQSIAQELIRKRGTQLDEAEAALESRRLDEATALTNAFTLPDDIAFRELRRRENDLRTRLLTARTVTSVTPPPATTTPAPPPPAPPEPEVPTPPMVQRILLQADAAELTGTKLKRQDTNGRRNIGYWNDSRDAPRWQLTIANAGRYQVDLLYAMQAGPTEVLLQIGQQQTRTSIGPTGEWGRYRTVDLGVFELGAGTMPVVLRPADPENWKPINVVYFGLVPSAATPTAAPIPVAPPPPPDPVPKPAGPQVVAWNGAFVTGGRDRPPRGVPLDGSEHVPSGLPGGVGQVFRSTKSQALKRHAAFLDLAGAPAGGGGVVVLIHPGRNDRNEIHPSLTDGKGTTVKLEPVTLPDDEWTPIVLPVSAANGLDPAALVTLALEDGPKAGHIPEDAGFLIGPVVTVSGRAPLATDLGLRASALLPDPRRLSNLPKLLEILAKSRKKPNWQKLIEPGRVRFVLGDWGRNQDWRAAMRKQLEPLVTGKQPQTMMSEINFDEGWLDAMTKAKDAALDPAAIHLAVLWTGGKEAAIFPDATQAMNGFWKKRLDQIMGAGLLPIVVIGPNLQPAEHRAKAEQIWQQVATLAPVRVYGMPVIDLRALPTAEDGTWDQATATLAAQLVVDGIGETIFSLRRLGAVK